MNAGHIFFLFCVTNEVLTFVFIMMPKITNYIYSSTWYCTYSANEALNINCSLAPMCDHIYIFWQLQKNREVRITLDPDYQIISFFLSIGPFSQWPMVPLYPLYLLDYLLYNLTLQVSQQFSIIPRFLCIFSDLEQFVQICTVRPPRVKFSTSHLIV